MASDASRRRIARFYSVLDPLPQLVDQLNAFQPAFLGTYASGLAAQTAEQEAGRLRISPLVITTGGELLSPAVVVAKAALAVAPQAALRYRKYSD